MGKQKSSLIGQLPELHRKLLRRIVERDGGDLSRDQFFRRELARDQKEIERYSGLNIYDLTLRNLSANFGYTDEDAEALARANIYGRGLLRRGIARRILRDDPGELAAALSLSARLDWLSWCEPGHLQGDSRYSLVWRVFNGLAAGDHAVARAFFGPRPRNLSAGSMAAVLIYNAVQAIVTENRRAQAQLRPEIEYANVPDIYRAILRTLLGIIIDDSTTVAVNLQQVLAKLHRYDLPDHEKVIAILAHGIAELANWVSPRLLEEFDLDSPWPWDGAYHRWLRRGNRSTKYLDLSKHSALMNRWIQGLEEPSWWRRGKRAR